MNRDSHITSRHSNDWWGYPSSVEPITPRRTDVFVDLDRAANGDSRVPTSQMAPAPDSFLSTIDFEDEEFLEQQRAILRQIEEDAASAKPSRQEAPRKPPARDARYGKPTIPGNLERGVLHSGDRYIDSLGSTVDFCSFLQDQDMIQEQRKILEGIQKGQSEEEYVAESTQAYPSFPSKKHDDDSVSLGDTAASLNSSLRRMSVRRHASLSVQSHRSQRSTQMDMYQRDRCGKVGSKSLRIKGTREVYKAIAKGTAVLVECEACQALMQVGPKTKHLFCTSCCHITPLLKKKSPEKKLEQASVHQDCYIAQALQEQEMDVACAYKMSRLAEQERRQSSSTQSLESRW